MGVQITNILVSRETSIEALKNKKFAVDSYNLLYQFLTTLRMHDGTPLKDSKGNITSHLSGLFSRTTNLMQNNLKLAFVFDGEPPPLKKEERERRKALKEEAAAQYEIAKEREDIEMMKKYGGRTARLTKEMVDEAKELITALGLPVVQAPSEGEAQAAHMAKKGEVYGLISQDTDCLAFGTPRMIKNLSISHRKKVAGKLSYETIKPEIIELKENLANLDITHDQLVALIMLVGTDFNIGGVKGIGPKNALKLVKQYGDDFDSMFKDVKWGDFFKSTWQDVFDTIKNMPTTDDYTLEWKSVDEDAIYEILCDRHGFSRERIEGTLEKLAKAKEKLDQKGLNEFFK